MDRNDKKMRKKMYTPSGRH